MLEAPPVPITPRAESQRIGRFDLQGLSRGEKGQRNRTLTINKFLIKNYLSLDLKDYCTYG
jgi:hypothetical protein